MCSGSFAKNMISRRTRVAGLAAAVGGATPVALSAVVSAAPAVASTVLAATLAKV